MNNYNHKVRLFKCFMIKCKKTLKGDIYEYKRSIYELWPSRVV